MDPACIRGGLVRGRCIVAFIHFLTLSSRFGRAGGDAAEGKTASFWAEAERLGLRLRLVANTSTEADVAATRPSTVLAGKVFYGRPILRVPMQALFDAATVSDAVAREELARFLDNSEWPPSSVGTTVRRDLLALALALVAEARDPKSVFRDWLDALRNELLPPVLQFTQRQHQFLEGTTVEVVARDLTNSAQVLEQAASGLSVFREKAISRDEVVWALGVVLRHARPALPHDGSPDPVGDGESRFRLIPLVSTLAMRPHPDPKQSIPLHERTAIVDGAEVKSLVQVARSDMSEGDEILGWHGRLSSSDLAIRFGDAIGQTLPNPTGIGGKAHVPENWNPRRNTPNFRVFEKFNCTSPSVFEMRFSLKGWPGRLFIRCSRIAQLLEGGWYNEKNVERIPLLDQWPPTTKYQHESWLGWTRADQAIGKILLEHCRQMKSQLRDAITKPVADDFRTSSDAIDKMLWRLRADESRAFRECISLALAVTKENVKTASD